MKYLNMESAVKRYNRIMDSIGCEHLTIGTELSEGTDNWNIRDMVAEADYLLSCYYENGNVRHDDRLDSEEAYKEWISETGKLKRFIKAYEPLINNIKCTENHCSKYDNAK